MTTLRRGPAGLPRGGKSARARLRDDFPRGWWRSARWWVLLYRDGAVQVLTLCAPALRCRSAARAVRHRRDPVRLARLDVEWFFHGLAANLLCLGLLPSISRDAWTSVPTWFPWAAAGLSVLNATVAAVVLASVLVSRRRERRVWELIDFVADNRAADGLPPQTPGEYAAEKIEARLPGGGTASWTGRRGRRTAGS